VLSSTLGPLAPERPVRERDTARPGLRLRARQGDHDSARGASGPSRWKVPRGLV